MTEASEAREAFVENVISPGPPSEVATARAIRIVNSGDAYARAEGKRWALATLGEGYHPLRPDGSTPCVWCGAGTDPDTGDERQHIDNCPYLEMRARIESGEWEPEFVARVLLAESRGQGDPIVKEPLTGDPIRQSIVDAADMKED